MTNAYFLHNFFLQNGHEDTKPGLSYKIPDIQVLTDGADKNASTTN